MNDQHRKIVWVIAVAVFTLVMALLTVFVGVPMIRLANQPEAFRNWVDSYGVWGRVLFVGIVVFQVIVAFVPGEPVELAAGYIFGVLEGTVLTMLGFLIGSAVIFLLVRRFGVKLVEVFFSKEKIQEIRFLNNPKKTKVLALILMTLPGTPKDFLSYFAGLTRLTLPQWLGIVLVSRFFSLITSTISGAAAGQRDYKVAAVVFAITGLISGAGVLYYRRLCRQERESEKA